MSKILDAARTYRDLGFPVIPFLPDDKNPDPRALASTGSVTRAGEPSWLQFTRRLPRDDELLAWFGPARRNLGMVTGYKRLLVVDFDDEAQFEEWRSRYSDVAGSTCIQRSPNGYHVLFRWSGTWTIPLRRTARFRCMEIADHHAGELLGSRRIVCMWPSETPAGSYSWFPGQAPWEMAVRRIRRLDDVGIHPIGTLLGPYIGALRKVLLHPREKLPLYLKWWRFRRTLNRGSYFRRPR